MDRKKHWSHKRTSVNGPEYPNKNKVESKEGRS
jgi:hypothetical protein